jgi:CHASE2 domain-containing sensor protein/tRNA A-37 threonylcarbamoyl transferase component Bud32
MNSLGKKSGVVLSISAILCILLILLGRTLPARFLESKIGDGFFALSNEQRIAKILIIDMGDEDPVSRSDLKSVLGFLKDKEPGAIGIDVLLFRDRDEPPELVKALEGIPALVIACELDLRSSDGINDSFRIKPFHGPEELKELKSGFVNLLPPSPDRIIREASIAINSGTYLSFPFRLCCMSKGVEPSDVHIWRDNLSAGNMFRIPLEPNGSMRINFCRRELFPVIPSSRLKDMDWKPFKGSIVLIGRAANVHDCFRTPIDNNLPGILVHAQIINTIMKGIYLRNIPLPLYGALCFILCLLSCAAPLFIRTHGLYLAALAALACLYAGSVLVLFLKSHALAPLFIPLTALLVSALAGLFYRLVMAEKAASAGKGILPGSDADKSPSLSRRTMGVSTAATPQLPLEDAGGLQEVLPQASPFPDFHPGLVIGKYAILEKIGSGGMGDVFVVEHQKLKVKRVLKVIKPELLPNDEVRDRFRQEAESAARLDNPNIIMVHDYAELGGVPCIEMEYFESYSLRAEIRRGAPLGSGRILTIMEKITAALQCAHHAKPRPMIHRDLKPENILISTQDPSRLKIIDFGLVKVLEEGLMGSNYTSSPLGTPYYMAPEQISLGKVGPGTDIYSAGVILFEMLTGKRPFEGSSFLEVLNKHIKNPVPSVLTLRPDCPLKVDSVFQKAMAKDMGARYHDMEDFFLDLKDAMKEHLSHEGSDDLEKTI